MALIATMTSSRLAIRMLLALLLAAALAIPAMAHEGKVDFGIDAVTITSATRITLGGVAVKGTVTCSKTTSGVDVYASVRQVAGRTNTISGEGYGTVRCVAGTKLPFSVLVTPEQGKFVGGSALVSADAYKEVYTETETSWHYHWDGASTERELKLTR